MSTEIFEKLFEWSSRGASEPRPRGKAVVGCGVTYPLTSKNIPSILLRIESNTLIKKVAEMRIIEPGMSEILGVIISIDVHVCFS